MNTTARTALLVGALVATCLAASVSAQESPASSSFASLDTPHALRMEDRHLRDDLARAIKDDAAVGQAAREVEHVLLPHLEHRERVVFRPLGLLKGLARDDSGLDKVAAIAAIDQIERELPALEEEHRAIYAASKRLVDAANRERKPQYLDLSDRIWVHMRLEEDVLYPTVILVGRYLKLQKKGPTTPQTTRR